MKKYLAIIIILAFSRSLSFAQEVKFDFKEVANPKYLKSTKWSLMRLWCLTPHGKMPAWLPKVGLELKAPTSMSQVAWYGREPFKTENGAKVCGVYEGSVAEQHVPYLIPQGNGNKSDVRWSTLTNEQGTGWLVAGSTPFGLRVLEYSTENLSRVMYIFQLKKVGYITLNID
ncbi:hypothetical protein R9C00_01295 [Flammeovirgaceae bacterium SG7u.111]|nr:hypothetical protein [Flammeovirgaceae bacterium SG7u.132]WPO36083.1 hypothetical protein R9C00_01295 [Flammeovirgaceae bacterium SG7u.111]